MTIFEEALWKAVEINNSDYVKVLINIFLNNNLSPNHKPSWYFTNIKGENLIYHAISCFGEENNPIKKLQRKHILNLLFDTLFEHTPAAIECLTIDNKTCFWLATYYQSLETLERLLTLNKKNLPISINNHDRLKQSQNTPLHLACQGGNVQIVEFLLKNKADTTKKNAKGDSALHIACATGHVKITTLLMEYNADTKQVNHKGNTPLHIACAKGYVKVATLLMQYNADTKQVNYDENTPLHLALAKKHFEIANLLLDRIEELNIAFPLFKENKSKETALFLAARHGYETFIKRIINYNPSLTIITEKNESLLYAACEGLCIDLVRYLLASNLDIPYQGTKSCFDLLGEKLSDNNISYKDHKKIMVIINLLLHYGFGINTYLPKKILENKEHLSSYLSIEIFKDNQERILFPDETAKNSYRIRYTSWLFLIDTRIKSHANSPTFLTIENAIHNYEEFKNKKFKMNYVIHHLPGIFKMIENIIKAGLYLDVEIEYVKFLEKIQAYCKKIPTELIFANELPEFKAELRKNMKHNFGELPEYLQALKKELYEINKYSSHSPMIQPQIEAFKNLSHIVHQLHGLAESIRKNLPKHRTLKAYIDYYNLELAGASSLIIGAAISTGCFTIFLTNPPSNNNNILVNRSLLIASVLTLGIALFGVYALYYHLYWDTYPNSPLDYPIKYILAYERKSLDQLKNMISEIIDYFKKNNKLVEAKAFQKIENNLEISNNLTISDALKNIKELINYFIIQRNAVYMGKEDLFSIYTSTRYNFFSPPIISIKQEPQTNLDKHRNTK